MRNLASGALLILVMATAVAQEPAGPQAATAEPTATPAAMPAATPALAPAVEPDAEPAADVPQQTAGGPRGLAGMSILGNQEAPTSLVIVPWKSSEIGNGIGVSRALDTGIHAVDRDVFLRELRYYEIRTGGGD